MEWPDLEAVLIGRALPAIREAVGPSVDMGPTVDLDDLDAGARYVRLHVVGGTDNGLTDSVRVDVECFAPRRPDATDMATAMRAIMHTMAGTADEDGGNLVDTVRTVQRPTPAPYRNNTTTRVVAAYTVETRLQ